MIISDKQELRRCVKQAVRRAPVCEALLDFDMAQGKIGIEAMLDTWAQPAQTPDETLKRATALHTPFEPDAAAMFAALQAMKLPIRDMQRAGVMIADYDRPAYLREVLDAMRARCVLVRVPLALARQVQLEDDRFEPLLAVEEELFTPGRYGVNYAQAAERIRDAAQACGARNLLLTRFDEQAVRYCLMPVCQERGYALHVQLRTCEEIDRFAQELDAFDGVRALVHAQAACERQLIDAAAQRVRLTACLTGADSLKAALRALGTRFVAYSAQAVQPEQMLGRWLLAREEIWQELAEAYIPLARSGYELESLTIERDIRRLLCDNLLALCRPE